MKTGPRNPSRSAAASITDDVLRRALVGVGDLRAGDLEDERARPSPPMAVRKIARAVSYAMHADVDRRHGEAADLAAAARQVQIVDRGRARAGRLAQLPEEPARGLALVPARRRPPARPAGRWRRSRSFAASRTVTPPAPRVHGAPEKVDHCCVEISHARAFLVKAVPDTAWPASRRARESVGYSQLVLAGAVARPSNASGLVDEPPAALGSGLVARAGPSPRR